MRQERQHVFIPQETEAKLVESLFRQDVPAEVIVRENPRSIVHHHSYGGLSRFFMGLIRGVLLGTKCASEACKDMGIWLPPRVHCPDCWQKMRWVKIDAREAKVYTFSVTNFPGAGFQASVPCPLISVEIPGVCTKFMSYLSEFSEDEPHIGMPIRPIFRKDNPTYTILDISWAPAD